MARDRDGAVPLSRSRSCGARDGGGSLPWIHVSRGIGVLEPRLILVSNRFISFKVNRATQVHIKIDVEVSHHPCLVLRLEERHIVLPTHMVHVHRRHSGFYGVRLRGRLLWLLLRGDCWSIRGLILWRRRSVYIGGGIITLLRVVLRFPSGIRRGICLGGAAVNGCVKS